MYICITRIYIYKYIYIYIYICIGFLGLGAEAAAYRPRRPDGDGDGVHRSAPGYDLEGADRHKSVPQGYKELVLSGHQPASGEEMEEHYSGHLAFYGTFPYATVAHVDWKLNDFLELSICAAEPGEAPVHCKAADYEEGGAVVAVVPSLKAIV